MDALFQAVDPALVRFRYAGEKWNLLDVACHLLDEEREDFRPRVKHILEQPREPMKSIDPAGWVNSRNYQGQDLQKIMEQWRHERLESVRWLKSLGEVPWKNIHLHPSLGEISAERMLASWLEHDFLHMRQVLKIKHHFLLAESGMDLSYAGSW